MNSTVTVIFKNRASNTRSAPTRRARGRARAASRLAPDRSPRASRAPCGIAGQSDDPLLASFRPGHSRDHNPARRDEIAKRLARRLDQAMHDHPIEALARAVKIKTVLPPDRDIGEPEGLDPGGGFDRQRLEPLKRYDRPSQVGRAKPRNILFRFRFRIPDATALAPARRSSRRRPTAAATSVRSRSAARCRARKCRRTAAA